MLRHFCRLERSAVVTYSPIAPLGVVTYSLAGTLAVDRFASTGWITCVDDETIEHSIENSTVIPTACYKDLATRMGKSSIGQCAYYW